MVSNNAATAAIASRFLELPLEVRRSLYDLLLTFPRRDHLNLLRVNKQVYNEARESFYKRPLLCRSQYDLVDFVDLWPEAVLQSITHLQLHLEEIRPEAIQEYLTLGMSFDPAQPHPHPYLLEINRITSAIAKMPNIAHLQLLRPTSLQRSIPSSIVLTQLLTWVAEHYPKLQSFRLDLEQCHIDCFGSFKELKSLRLTGYSETSPTRTADVLSKMTSLEELIIVGPPPGLRLLQQQGFQTKIVQSVTHQLFERIRPLRRLTLAEVTDGRTDSSAFLTSKTMRALFEVHQESLRSLHVSSNTTPLPPFLEYLSAFLLGATNMQELNLTWPDMETTFVDCIPNSVRRLRFAVASRDGAHTIINRLTLMCYRLKYLQHIKFDIINPSHETTSEKKEDHSALLAFSMPIQNLVA